MGRNDAIMPPLTEPEQHRLGWLYHELYVLMDKIDRRSKLDGCGRAALLNDTYYVTHHCVSSFLRKAPVERRAALATAVYWMHDNEIVRFAISEGLGVLATDLVNHLYLYPRPATCQCCGRETELLRRAWQMDDAETQECCPNCADSSAGADLRKIPYREYLQTEHWQKVRDYALERAEHRCQVCNASGELHTHHRTYDRRGEEMPSDVIVLCAGCHKLFHDNGKLARGDR